MHARRGGLARAQQEKDQGYPALIRASIHARNKLGYDVTISPKLPSPSDHSPRTA